MDTFARVPSASIVRLHMDPEGPTPGVSNTAVLGGMPEEAVDAFLATVGHGTSTSLLVAELRQLGGALVRPAAGAGALSLDARRRSSVCITLPPPPFIMLMTWLMSGRAPGVIPAPIPLAVATSIQ